MVSELLTNKAPKKAHRKPIEALSWVNQGLGSLKRSEGLESWPFPTFKGQPLELVKYSKPVKINPQWPEALL